jgi:3-phosphoshikimate 1-carboxyvinyltransferase
LHLKLWLQHAQKNIRRCKALGLIQYGYATPEEAVQDADLIVLALPVRATQKYLNRSSLILQTMSLLPMCSTKGNVLKLQKQYLVKIYQSVLYPGHPIAGAEHTGVHAGKVDLFVNHKVILTPLPTSADWAVEKLIQLWSAAKAEVIYGCH